MPHHVTLYSNPKCRFPVEANETILEAAQKHGVDIPSSCEAGICSTCKGKIYQGTVNYNDVDVTGIDPNNTKGDALFCVARPECDLVIDHPDLPLPYPTKSYAYQVVEHSALHPNLIRIRLKPIANKMSFVAGQYINLIDEQQRHPLSIASIATDDFIELHIQNDERHNSAPRILMLCEVGKTVTLQGPLGKAYLRDTGDMPIILVAGGSGFAPIKSILETLIHQSFAHPIYLYWGTREPSLLYFDEDLKQLVKAHPQVHYIPVVSENTLGWTGRTGLVTDAVCTDFPSLAKYACYLAGPFEMSYVAREQFVKQGMLVQYLYSDAFAFSK